MKKIVIPSIILIIVIMVYLIFPYYCIYKLAISLKEADRYALENYINFGSVRASLKEQINAKMMAELIKEKELKDNPFAGLAMLIGPKLVDYALETYLTPSGLAALIGSGNLENNINKLQEQGFPMIETAEDIDFWNLLSKAEYAFFANPSTFLIEIEGTKFRFKLQDWSWKLVGIYFPDKSNAKQKIAKLNSLGKLRGEKSFDEHSLAEGEESYWIKSSTANVRAGPSTTYSIIMTLKQGDKVYLVDRLEKWVKVKLTEKEDNIGWIHSSLLSEYYVAPPPSFKIIDVEIKVTEKNDVWWKYAWRLRVQNSDISAVSLTAIIEFQDKDGFIIEQDTEYDLNVPAGKERTFTGYALINAKVAKNVAQVDAKVHR